MTKEVILAFCRRNVGRAVVVKWVDPNSDWHHFRVERVLNGRVAMTGMADADANQHHGDFFWVAAASMRRIALRT